MVVTPSLQRSAVPRLLHGLSQQTLPAGAFEVLLLDQGCAPPLRLGIPLDLQERVQFVSGEGDRSDLLARAVQRCQGTLALFLAGDTVVHDETLAQHVCAHEAAARTVAVVGVTRPAFATRDGLALQAARAGLLYPFREPQGASGEVLCFAQNLSAPTAALRTLGAFRGPSGTRIEDLALGFAWQRAGLPLVQDDSIVVQQEFDLDVDGFVQRCRWLGHDWSSLRREGTPAPDCLVGPGRTRGRARVPELLQVLLAEAGPAGDALDELRRIEAATAVQFRSPPTGAPSWKSHAEPAGDWLPRVFRQELRRGFLDAMQGFTPRQAASLARDAASLAVLVRRRTRADDDVLRLVLETLPEDATLFALADRGQRSAGLRLPRDPRLDRRFLTERGDCRALLEASRARSVAVLDGSRIPDAREWHLLRTTLGASAAVGAVSLSRSPRPGAPAVRVTPSGSNPVLLLRRGFLAAASDGDPTAVSGCLEALLDAGQVLVEVCAGPRSPAPQDLPVGS